MTTPIHVHFVPRWRKNPYHDQLARHLATLSVDVGDESRLKQILLDSRRSGTRPEIVHLHALPAFRWHFVTLARIALFWFRLHRLRRAGVKIVWTVHDIANPDAMHPLIDRMWSRWCYRAADAVIVHSLGAKEFIEQQWRVRRRHDVYVVPHAHFADCYRVDADAAESRAKLHLPPESLVFLFLGNIRRYKGVANLVRVFKALATPSMRLVIAGEPLTDELQCEIERQIGASELISFRPQFVPDDEVRFYMAAADVVVFPYTKALTSGALILAMSFGRACIAPRMGALGDTLDEQGGFLFAPDAPDGLATAIAAAIAARAELPRMGAYNREHALRWGWSDAARQTAATYRACLAAGP